MTTDCNESERQLGAVNGYAAALVAAGDGYLAEDALKALSPRQITVLYARMIEGRTLKETGEVVRSLVSGRPNNAERIRQIEACALRKVRGWVLRHNEKLTHEAGDQKL